MRTMERRLEKLEHAGRGGAAVVCLDRKDETTDEAVARHLANHPQDRRAGRFIVVDTGVYR